MNTAQKIVDRSCKPSLVCNWRQWSVEVFKGKQERKGIVRFKDGSAIVFIRGEDGREKPVEFVG